METRSSCCRMENRTAVLYESGFTLEKGRSRLKNAGIRLNAAVETQVGVGSAARAYITASRNYRRLVRKFIAQQVSMTPAKRNGENRYLGHNGKRKIGH